MDNLFLFIAFSFLFIFLFGHLLEKIKVPWLFSALFLGIILSFFSVPEIISSPTFEFLAKLGMYFLLFIVGFEINLGKLKEQRFFIFKSALIIILFEAILGSLIVHYIFGYGWLLSVLIALSFATVGEAILVPILDEFKIINTKLGQSIIGIGTIDDILEIILLFSVMAFIGYGHNQQIFYAFLSLIILFLLTLGFKKFKEQGNRFNYLEIETLFLFALFVIFLFIGIGKIAEAEPLAAFLAGIALRSFVPEKRLKIVENEIKTISYGFFAPFFFIWVGQSMDLNYLIKFPLLVLLIILVSNGAKILASLFVGRRELGLKDSLLLGVGLSARFSTSIIIVKLLFENKIIHSGIYSVIIASSIIFTLIIPITFSYLLSKWKREPA